MSKDEWLQRNLANAPPLSPAQLAILRNVFRPVLPRETEEAAPARQQGPPVPAMTALPERTDQ